MELAKIAFNNALKNKTRYLIGEYTPDPNVHCTYVLQNDGLYDVYETNLARFVFKVSNNVTKINGLDNVVSEGLTLKIPKIPVKYINSILEWFKIVYKEYNTEAACRLYYNHEKNDFFIYIPKQKVFGALVKWTEVDGDIENLDKNNVLVMQIHSHHNMIGRFSATDDADHQYLDGIYMVMGDIFKPVYSYQINYAMGTRKVEVPFHDIIQVSNDIDLSFASDWKNMLEKETYKIESTVKSDEYPLKWYEREYNESEWPVIDSYKKKHEPNNSKAKKQEDSFYFSEDSLLNNKWRY